MLHDWFTPLKLSQTFELSKVFVMNFNKFAEFPVRRAVGMDSDGAVAPISCWKPQQIW